MVEKNCLPDLLVGNVRTIHMQTDALDWDDTCTDIPCHHILPISHDTTLTWIKLIHRLNRPCLLHLTVSSPRLPYAFITTMSENSKSSELYKHLTLHSVSHLWPVLLLLDWGWGSNIGAHHNDSSHPPCLLPPEDWSWHNWGIYTSYLDYFKWLFIWKDVLWGDSWRSRWVEWCYGWRNMNTTECIFSCSYKWLRNWFGAICYGLVVNILTQKCNMFIFPTNIAEKINGRGRHTAHFKMHIYTG